MITRFYVDNYKCLQNFEYKPKQFELVVGANGSGKSTVFEALDKVRRFAAGQDARDLFSIDTITRWDKRLHQTFELDYEVGSDKYTYRLEIDTSSHSKRVEKESVSGNGKLLITSVWEHVENETIEQVVNNHHLDEDEEFLIRKIEWKFVDSSPKFIMSNANHSISSYHPQSKYLHPTTESHFYKTNPQLMTAQVRRPEPRPANDLSNFASYYIYALQQQQGKIFEMISYLKEVIFNFDSFAVEENFEEARRDLFIVCRSKEKGKNSEIRYRFDELSDGQRALIALYTLLFCTLDENTTLVIDEPENYVALRELQPWLSLLQERLEEHGGQVILISHHPEFINALAPQTTVFERDNGGPVRVKDFDSELAKTLAPAEIMARGWES